MQRTSWVRLDLMPPAFEEGLYDWSRGDGEPDSPTYATAENVRIARGDADFGTCLELRKVDPVQKIRYMGELPVLPGAFLEVSTRVKALRGPLPVARIAAWPGGAGAAGVVGLRTTGEEVPLEEHDAVRVLRAVIGPTPAPEVDMVWDARVLYAHVGLDILGADNAVVRIDRVCVRDVSDAVVERLRMPPPQQAGGAAAG
jgi:hypothetical protein